MKRTINIFVLLIMIYMMCITTYAENSKIQEYPCIYDQLSHFENGYAIAEYNDKYCIIDSDNNIIYQTNTPTLCIGKEIFIFTDESGCNVCDLSGNVIKTLPDKVGIDIYEDNYIQVIDVNAKMHGIISIEGNEVLSSTFSDIDIYGETCIASRDGNWYVINLQNSTITYTTDENISFLNKEMILISNNNKYGLVDINGSVIYDAVYDNISFQNTCYILTTYAEDQDENIILDENFNEILTFSGSFISCTDNNIIYTSDDHYYIITKNGKIEYKKHISTINTLGGFSEGIAIEQSLNDAYYYINYEGVKKEDYVYDLAHPFKNGHAIVYKKEYDSNISAIKGQYYVINHNYDVIYKTNNQLCYDKDIHGQITFENDYIITYDPETHKYGFIKLITNSNFINTYNIIYDINGDTDKISTIKNLPVHSKIILPNCNYKEFIFSHWTDGTNNYNPGDTYIMPDHDVTLIAVWKTDWEYSINADEVSVTLTSYIGSESEVIIPAEIDGYTVTAIGERALENNTTIQSIVFPKTLRRIETFALYGCSSLAEIHLPASVEYIGDYALAHCTANTAFNVDPENAYFCADDSGVLYTKDMTKLLYYPSGNPRTEYTVHTDTLELGGDSFNSAATLISVNLPEILEIIGSYAFAECRNLQILNIPENAILTGESTFWGCSSLRSVTLPANTETIAYGTFYRCTSLTEIVIPAGVDYIGSWALSDCTNLRNIYFLGDVPETWCENAISDPTEKTLFYTEGKNGWTSPTWTSGDGYEFSAVRMNMDVSITVEANKTQAYPGDTISYTVSLNNSNLIEGGVWAYAFGINISEGLEYVTGSGKLDKNLTMLTGFYDAYFDETTLTSSTSGNSYCGYEREKLTILHFECRVPDDAEGSLFVSVGDPRVAKNNGAYYERVEVFPGSPAFVSVLKSGEDDAVPPRIITQPAGAHYITGDTVVPLSISAEVSDGGTLSYSWYQKETNISDGFLVGTGPTFTPSADIPGVYCYYVEVTNTTSSAEGSTEAAVYSSTAVIRVSDPRKGDINADGEVNMIDGELFAQYYAGQQNADCFIRYMNADLNDDGEITRADAMILSRYLAGWPGYSDYILGVPELDGELVP